MTDADFLVRLVKEQNRPVNLSEICSCIPNVPRSNVKEMLGYMAELGKIKKESFGYLFPTVYSVPENLMENKNAN